MLLYSSPTTISPSPDAFDGISGGDHSRSVDGGVGQFSSIEVVASCPAHRYGKFAGIRAEMQEARDAIGAGVEIWHG